MPNPFREATIHGQLLWILFETSTDLTPFLPAGIAPVNPHRAFIKAERLKIRSAMSDVHPPAFNQYQQICLTTLAQTAPGAAPAHRNILMWEDRHWAIGSSMAAAKRYGQIEMTQVFETERAAIDQGAPIPFRVDVETSGFSLLRFDGELDGVERAVVPPYGQFFVGGEAGSALQVLTLKSHSLSRPLHGTGTLTFGEAPNERGNLPGSGEPWPASMFEDIRVTGCVLQDIQFTRVLDGEFTLVRPATA